ncbi:cobalamin biosynthesis Mg chelatase CobN [Cupriavidus metallidurans]|jgi:cobalamin biosynthesis Mg chelatase CobN|uniref:Uncharacterized protein n=1 Tax=Cupriavidus metallidurans (strain ATCC 43123 / DSM 2839 / NBRC 102507 / CH34) TaxID=266264 RepID=D3DY15_CUPMC|nr:hypothetical protein [Cupriavidus metallidurans]ADC45185.1 hypothetical protein; putative exported protein [Cupriavidus metallidurans CH34]MDE4919545.1 hypothetical protein [Cupriavidus metallidurans]QGS29120.1 hypothetical protein FOB83_09560 [Cupriavidus metallidurans]UBM10649.1 hypothetical protein LAI70_25770 [Cupriavidus metallidurans]
MATQRPVGTRSTSRSTSKASTSTSTSTSTNNSTQAGAPGSQPRRETPRAVDLGADTTIWHTRGLQTNSRMRMPVMQRTPSRQLPPSPIPRLILWAVLIGLALVCFNAVKHMLR